MNKIYIPISDQDTADRIKKSIKIIWKDLGYPNGVTVPKLIDETLIKFIKNVKGVK